MCPVGPATAWGQEVGQVRQHGSGSTGQVKQHVLGHAGNTGLATNIATYHYQNCIHAAMAGFDYTSISVNQIFASGSANGTTKCVDIFVRDDETLEGNQTFTVAIATSDSNVMLGTDVTVISIVDNDGNAINYVHPVQCVLHNYMCMFWHLDSEQKCLIKLVVNIITHVYCLLFMPNNTLYTSCPLPPPPPSSNS